MQVTHFAAERWEAGTPSSQRSRPRTTDSLTGGPTTDTGKNGAGPGRLADLLPPPAVVVKRVLTLGFHRASSIEVVLERERRS